MAGSTRAFNGYDDYPTTPIGGSNPYHMCSHCGMSVPGINGILGRHSSDCKYRLEKEREIRDEMMGSGPLTLDRVIEFMSVHLSVEVSVQRGEVFVALSLCDEIISRSSCPIRGY